MPDFRTNLPLYNEYKNILRSHLMEGNRRSFYLDTESLVTIGVGRLVEHGGVNVEQEATRLLNVIGNNGFRNRATGAIASLVEIQNDWTAVNNGHISSLTITEASSSALLNNTINSYCNVLFHTKPFASDLPQKIQIAIIDVRFNPSGVVLYGATMNNNFWPFLDPSDVRYNLQTALDYFRNLWTNPNDRYIQRVNRRVTWFQEGINETLL